MVTTVLKKNKLILYDCRQEMGALAWFLSTVSETDFLRFEHEGDERYSFLEWLKENDLALTRMERDTILAIKESDRIFIGHCFNKDGSFDLKNREENFDWVNAFGTSRENLMHIIQEWYALLSMDPHPDEIIMMEDGDKVTFQPKFYSETKIDDQCLPKIGFGLK